MSEIFFINMLKLKVKEYALKYLKEKQGVRKGECLQGSKHGRILASL